MDSSHDEVKVQEVVEPQSAGDTQAGISLEEHADNDPVIDLAACHDAGPWLTLILPEEAAEQSSGLALVTAENAAEEDQAEGAEHPRFDSPAVTSFSDWAEQVSGEFTPPDNEPRAKEERRPRKVAMRDVAAQNLWSSLEPTIHLVEALEAPVPMLAMVAPEPESVSEAGAEPATGGPMVPPPPAPPERIGAGQRVDRRSGWKAGNSLAALANGALNGFRWGRMFRIAGATAACGMLFVLVMHLA